MSGKPQHFEHGTLSRYYQGCRCVDCRATNTARCQRLRQNLSEEQKEQRRIKTRAARAASRAALSEEAKEIIRAKDRERRKRNQKPRPKAHGTVERYDAECRCEECIHANFIHDQITQTYPSTRDASWIFRDDDAFYNLSSEILTPELWDIVTARTEAKHTAKINLSIFEIEQLMQPDIPPASRTRRRGFASKVA